MRVRAAQGRWAETPARERLRVVRRFRNLVAARADRLAESVTRPPAETLSAEILPLAEACRFLERNAEQLLAARHIRSYKPLWMRSVDIVTRREPFGVVLIIGPANYPIFLPGVQMVQALTAANGVLLKPGAGGSAPAALLIECATEAGVPPDVIVLLDESPEAASEAIRCGVDKVLITGSKQTGKAVLSSVAPHIIPVVAELSGWDPVFVLADADISLAASAIRFGINLNRGNTCIRPRVVYAAPEILSRLRAELGVIGNEIQLTPVESDAKALRRASQSEYALGATVFGSTARAEKFAQRIRAGVVVINDIIVPTAHPAIAFGGRGSSGFGVTRGAEGLLELTTIKTIAVQRSRWRPHLNPPKSGDARLFSAFVRALHGGSPAERIRACVDLWHAARNRRKETPCKNHYI